MSDDRGLASVHPIARGIGQGAGMSNYGQIRLTVTFERQGRLSYRALAKRPQDGWAEQHVFATGSDVYPSYPPLFSDAMARFALVAEALRWLPPSLD